MPAETGDVEVGVEVGPVEAGSLRGEFNVCELAAGCGFEEFALEDEAFFVAEHHNENVEAGAIVEAGRTGFVAQSRGPTMVGKCDWRVGNGVLVPQIPPLRSG
jgi:hypothetical protein